MPFFDMKCKKCGHEEEDFVSSHAKLNLVCEKCGGEREQIYRPFGFTVKDGASPNRTSNTK